MRLERFHIDRFGVLADQGVGALSPGLNIFLGRNEAGKSTCLRFFQSMLFGYKRGNRSLDPVQSRGKGLAGGTLVLQTESAGIITLTRRPGPRGGVLSLTDPAGREIAEPGLQALFGNLTVDVFDSIFAFSLQNLMEFSSLSGDSVRHALHGAAFGTGLKSPSQVLRTLEEQMKNLVKSGTGQAPVNAALREWQAVREEAASNVPALEAYREVQVRLQALESELEALEREREGNGQKLRRATRRKDMWRQWEALRRVRAELSLLPGERIVADPIPVTTDGQGDGVRSGVSCPACAGAADSSVSASSSAGSRAATAALPSLSAMAPDAVQRLDALLARLEEQQLTEREAVLACQRLEADIAALPPSTALASLGDQVQALREQKERRRIEAESYPALRLEIAQLEELQTRSLSRLGPGWDAARIAAADYSLATSDRVRRFAASLEEKERAVQEAGRRLDQLGSEVDEALRQEEAAAERILPARLSSPPPDPAFCATLAGYLATAESALDGLPALLDRERTATAQALEAVRDLDPSLSLERLGSLEFSAQARQTIRDTAERMRLAATVREQADGRQALAAAGFREAEQRFAAARERLSMYQGLPDAENLHARRVLLEQIREQRMELTALRREHDAARAAAEAGGPVPGSPAGPAGLVADPLFVGGAQFLTGGLVLASAGWLGDFSPFLLAGAGLTLLGTLCCLARWVRPPGRPPNAALPKALEQAIRAAGDRCREQETVILALLAEDSVVSELLQGNGIDSPAPAFTAQGPGTVEQDRVTEQAPGLEPNSDLPGPQALAHALRALEAEERQSLQRERDAADADEAAQRLADAEALAHQAREAQHRAAVACEQLETAWRSLFRKRGLACPAAHEAPLFLDRAAAALSLARGVESARAARRTAEKAVANCLSRAAGEPFLAPCLQGLSLAEGTDTGSAHRAARPHVEAGPRPEGPPEISLQPHSHAAGPGLISPEILPSAAIASLDTDPETVRPVLRRLREALAAALADQEAAQEQRRLAMILDERRKARLRSQERLAEAASRSQGIEQALDAELAEWRKANEALGFPAQVSPGLAVEMLEEMRAFLERHKELALRLAHAEAVSQGTVGYVRDILALADQAGHRVDPGLMQTASATLADGGSMPPERFLAQILPQALTLLDAIGARVARASRDAATLEEKRQQLGTRTTAVERARAALEFNQQALREMYEQAGVNGAEEFRSAFALEERRRSLKHREKSLLAELAAQAGEENVSLDDLCADLERRGLHALEQEVLDLEQSLAHIGIETGRLSEERGSLLERRKMIMAGEGEAVLHRREAELRENLQRMSRRWAVAALARQLLLQAKESLEAEGQQGVLRHAGDIFSAITGGEYSGISASLDGEAYAAVRASGERLDPEKQLSQGAREQLYLALRLAYVKNHSRKAESVPLVLDDILVNFDPVRAANTARVLGGFSTHNQLLYFTCHPAAAEALLGAARESDCPTPAFFEVRKGEIHCGYNSIPAHS